VVLPIKISVKPLPLVLNNPLGLGGAFAVATKDGLSTVSLTTPVRDITSMAADVVDEALALFDVILAASLPTGPSLEFLRTQEEQWKERQ
jgi:hypothetical protein